MQREGTQTLVRTSVLTFGKHSLYYKSFYVSCTKATELGAIYLCKKKKNHKKGGETSESSKSSGTSDKMSTIECIELVLLEYHKNMGKTLNVKLLTTLAELQINTLSITST